MATSICPVEVTVHQLQQKQAFSTPAFIWDAATLGSGCSLTDNSQRLVNDVARQRNPPPSNPYQFPGTRASVHLTSGDVVYWEIWWMASMEGSFNPGVKRLLHLGAATEEVLRATREDTELDRLNRAAITVVFEVDQEGSEYQVWAAHGPRELDPGKLLLVPDNTACIGVRMGFLFDGASSTFYVTRASTPCILWMSEMDVSQPLYPFACVGRKERLGKEVLLQLKSGANIDMTPEKRKFLEDLIRGDVLRYQVIPYMS